MCGAGSARAFMPGARGARPPGPCSLAGPVPGGVQSECWWGSQGHLHSHCSGQTEIQVSVVPSNSAPVVPGSHTGSQPTRRSPAFAPNLGYLLVGKESTIVSEVKQAAFAPNFPQDQEL